MQEHLSERLAFDPHWVADPPPEIFRIIRELDVKVQRDVAAVVLRTQVAMAQARIDGLNKIAEIIGSSAR